MIDISSKKITKREAVASAIIYAKSKTIQRIKNHRIPKGDVLNTAKIAALMNIKNTANIIPMCHPVKITFADIKYSLGKDWIKINSTVKGKDKTGFEMEALVGASICALTIYDMCKPIDKEMVIADIKLIKKSGGKSGEYERHS